MIEFIGKVERILFQKDDFMIAVLKDTKSEAEIRILGNIYDIKQGDTIKVKGEKFYHHKYGEQVRVEDWEKPIPETKKQIIDFLSSGLVRGVGKVRAELIADTLGDNAIKLILEQGADALKGIKTIGEKTAFTIAESVIKTYEVQEIIKELAEFNIDINLSLKIYKKYGKESVTKIKENPFIITEIDRVSFERADLIAKQVGLPPYSGYRIDACINYVLNKLCVQNGHTFINEGVLLQHTVETLNKNVDEENHLNVKNIESNLYNLEDKTIVIENGNVYPKHYFKYESELALKLARILNKKEKNNPKNIDNLIKEYQKENGIILANKQREAIKMMLKEQVLILTGLPGTGKTTVVKAIIDIYKKVNNRANIKLASPTGRASRKLSESTGHHAVTIHRLIGYNEGLPIYNEENKMEADLVIIDEMSMADLQLTYWLVSALENDTKILFIGDTDQLPSVSVGNVLNDLVKSGIPKIKLTEVFRQAKESQIIQNSHRINNGLPLLVDNSKDDFYFIEEKNIYAVEQYILRSAQRFIDLGYSLDDILILSPMRNGIVGTINLNNKLREILNPKSDKKKELKSGKRTFRVGDKVMQNINNPEKDVFNGELGTVRSIYTIDENGRKIDYLLCKFDEKMVEYRRSDLNELDLGYSLTIHKSQGGEADVVIIPIVHEHEVMLARNLYYTGITRAKQRVVLIGTYEAMNLAIANNKVNERNSTLDKRIIQSINYVNRYNTNTLSK